MFIILRLEAMATTTQGSRVGLAHEVEFAPMGGGYVVCVTRRRLQGEGGHLGVIQGGA